MILLKLSIFLIYVRCESDPPKYDFSPVTDQLDSSLTTGCSKPNFPQLERKRSSSRIVGGNVAVKNSWPWIALVKFPGWDCGGSIIDNEWIITAGHCCWHSRSVKVIIGEHNKYFRDGEVSVDGLQIIVYPEYDFNDLKHDICLIKTLPIPQSNLWNTVCLPDQPPPYNTNGWVAGWGAKAYNGRSATVLKEVGVNLFDSTYCNNTSNFTAEGMPIRYPLEFCAGIPDDDDDDHLTQGGSDACQGDSGGPLVVSEDGEPVLSGLVSWGEGCAWDGFPGIYTNVFNYLNWIYETVQDPYPIHSTGIDVCWKYKTSSEEAIIHKIRPHSKAFLNCKFQTSNDQNCRRFSFRFEDLNITESLNCDDFVEISWIDDLEIQKSTSRICGNSTKFSLWTTVNTEKLDIFYHTDHSVTGFEFQWKTNNCNEKYISDEIDPTWIIDDPKLCWTAWTAAESGPNSISTRDGYVNNQECRFFVPNTKNCRSFGYRFVDFDTEDNFDFAEIQFESGFHRVTGNVENNTQWNNVESSDIELYFHSDQSITGRGFTMEWSWTDCQPINRLSASNVSLSTNVSLNTNLESSGNSGLSIHNRWKIIYGIFYAAIFINVI